MIATIIFGNGIGMALDPEYFQLSVGLQTVWDKLSPDEKKLVSLGNSTMPLSEEELERHHLIMTACQELMRHENNDLDWLNPNGKSFPNLYQNFIYNVAKYFFEYNGNLPTDFLNSLCQFVKKIDRCHIATLNYDKLLYLPLINEHILEGYKDHGLVDGICREAGGFQQDNLLRIHYNFGWYLHLHGSPIFQTIGNEINKCNLNMLPNAAIYGNVIHNHIVIAKTELKPEIISNSSILGIYFMFFGKALSESDELYIIGYSGLDKHVNFEIKNWASTKINSHNVPKINVIEWEGSDHNNNFWHQILIPKDPLTNLPHEKHNLQLKKIDNILNYQFPNN